MNTNKRAALYYTLERDNRELQLQSTYLSSKQDYTLERDNRELQRIRPRSFVNMDYTLERDNRELQLLCGK